jgi:hypothetical protein
MRRPLGSDNVSSWVNISGIKQLDDLCSQLPIDWNDPTGHPLRCIIGQMDVFPNLTVSPNDHRPPQSSNLLRPKSCPNREQEYDLVPKTVTASIDMVEHSLNL